MSLHLEILSHIKDALVDHPLKGSLSFSNDKDNLRIIFKNIRKNHKKNMDTEPYVGLHLTDEGLQLTKICFKGWEIQLKENWKLLPKHTIFLERHCLLPYHINKNYITLFESDKALVLKLYSDLDLYMKSVNKDTLKK